MNFKLPDDFKEKMRQEHEMKYVTLEDGSQKHVTEFNDKSITLEQYENMRMNSYARNDIYPKLDNDLLLEQAEYYISQCHKPYRISTYNDAIIHLILPEFIKRFKELSKSDASKEESSINYYNEMKRLEDEVKYFKGYEHPKFFNVEDGEVGSK